MSLGSTSVSSDSERGAGWYLVLRFTSHLTVSCATPGIRPSAYRRQAVRYGSGRPCIMSMLIVARGIHCTHLGSSTASQQPSSPAATDSTAHCSHRIPLVVSVLDGLVQR